MTFLVSAHCMNSLGKRGSRSAYASVEIQQRVNAAVARVTAAATNLLGVSIQQPQQGVRCVGGRACESRLAHCLTVFSSQSYLERLSSIVQQLEAAATPGSGAAHVAAKPSAATVAVAATAAVAPATTAAVGSVGTGMCYLWMAMLFRPFFCFSTLDSLSSWKTRRRVWLPWYLAWRRALAWRPVLAMWAFPIKMLCRAWPLLSPGWRTWQGCRRRRWLPRLLLLRAPPPPPRKMYVTLITVSLFTHLSVCNVCSLSPQLPVWF